MLGTSYRRFVFDLDLGSLLLASMLVCLLVIARATPLKASDDGAFGVLIMAHGGTDEWDQAVLDAVATLGAEYPIQVAFGMADASTIEEGVQNLEAAEVEQIGVVRLFISGESWFERTEQILGLIEGAPSAAEARAEAEAHSEHEEQAGHGNTEGHDGDGGEEDQDDSGLHHQAPFYRIDSEASFALSTDGLAQAQEMDEVLLSRARALSTTPESEDVLFLAHGPGDDAENERWIATIYERTGLLRNEIPFRRVEVMTLREDWPEKRKEAEEKIRGFVNRAGEEAGQAIVIPYRVFGFGPYAEILEGMEYVSDGQGLLPHEAVTRWIGRQAGSLQAGPFRQSIDKE
jgi:hypothetical protein